MYIQYLHLKASQWFVHSVFHPLWLNLNILTSFFFPWWSPHLQSLFQCHLSLSSWSFTHFNPSVTSKPISVCHQPTILPLTEFHCSALNFEGRYSSTLNITNLYKSHSWVLQADHRSNLKSLKVFFSYMTAKLTELNVNTVVNGPGNTFTANIWPF